MSRKSKNVTSADPSMLIEGIHPVREALDAGVALKKLFVSASDNKRGNAALKGLLRQAESRHIPVKTAERALLDAMAESGVHQGVIAEIAPFRYEPLEGVLQNTDGALRPRLIVVADHLTDAGNLGALIRSAEAVGAAGLVIPNRRSAMVTAATFKASAGAVAHLPVSCVPNIVHALDQLKEAGFWVVGASEHASETIWDVDLKGPIAMVVGNEATGLSDLARKRCDLLVKLPMRGHVASLNVAQAATACFYEWLRQNAATEVGDGV